MSSLETVRFLHAGDLHLASPVEALSAEAPSGLTRHAWMAELLDPDGPRTVSLA